MNLLNRYLQEVGKYLPTARRDDITAELRANLTSQMEDREEELGRSLTEIEQAEILRHHGNPTIVAGRYRDDNLGFAFGVQLIGPELFPIYKTVLAIILSISAVVLVGAALIVVKTGGEQVTAARVLVPVLLQIAITTLIFILMDRGKGHYLNRWDPLTLPQVKEQPEHGVVSLIALALGTLWLALTPRWPFLMLGPGAWYLAIPMKLMPQWVEFYWAIVTLLCAQVVLEAFRVFRWMPRRQVRICVLILKGVGLCINVGLLLEYPNYVTAADPKIAEWANLTFLICLIVALAINLFDAGKLLFSLLRERDQMLPARQY